MLVLVAVLTLINVPLAFFLAARFELESYLPILGVILVQYLVSAFISGQLLSLVDSAPSIDQLGQGLKLGIIGVVFIAPMGIPIMLIVALLVHARRRRGAQVSA